MQPIHFASLLTLTLSLVTACGGGGGSGGPAPDASSEITFVASNRTIVSGGAERSYVLSVPETPTADAKPLVFVLHGDGGNGTSMRASLPLESYATSDAVFVYPNVSGNNTFAYYSDEGRTAEALFVQDVIAALDAELDIDTTRVFITGFSGGATMANALGCRLGPNVIRGLGIHSGSLYATTNAADVPDFTYTGSGGVSCPLPATMFVWGQNDGQSGVTFAIGEGVRDNYLATQTCDATTTSAPVPECKTYDGCDRAVIWCPIPGMGHSIWSGAASAFWTFFDGLR